MPAQLADGASPTPLRHLLRRTERFAGHLPASAAHRARSGRYPISRTRPARKVWESRRSKKSGQPWRQRRQQRWRWQWWRLFQQEPSALARCPTSGLRLRPRPRSSPGSGSSKLRQPAPASVDDRHQLGHLVAGSRRRSRLLRSIFQSGTDSRTRKFGPAAR